MVFSFEIFDDSYLEVVYVWGIGFGRGRSDFFEMWVVSFRKVILSFCRRGIFRMRRFLVVESVERGGFRWFGGMFLGFFFVFRYFGEVFRVFFSLVFSVDGKRRMGRMYFRFFGKVGV